MAQLLSPASCRSPEGARAREGSLDACPGLTYPCQICCLLTATAQDVPAFCHWSVWGPCSPPALAQPAPQTSGTTMNSRRAAAGVGAAARVISLRAEAAGRGRVALTLARMPSALQAPETASETYPENVPTMGIGERRTRARKCATLEHAVSELGR